MMRGAIKIVISFFLFSEKVATAIGDSTVLKEQTMRRGRNVESRIRQSNNREMEEQESYHPLSSSKLQEALVSTDKSAFLLKHADSISEQAIDALNIVDAQVQIVLVLIAEAKKQWEYGHKEYSCELVELIVSLTDDVIDGPGSPRGSLVLAESKVGDAVRKVEDYIHWFAQYGYLYSKQSQYVKKALYALQKAAGAVEEAKGTVIASDDLLAVLLEAALNAKSPIEAAYHVCNNNYDGDLNDLLQEAENAMNYVLDHIGPLLLKVVEGAKITVPAAAAAVEEAQLALELAIQYKYD